MLRVMLKVSEVEARSALIQLTPPTVDAAELDVEPSEFQYELSLSDRHDGTYTVMYRSASVMRHFFAVFFLSALRPQHAQCAFPTEPKVIMSS